MGVFAYFRELGETQAAIYQAQLDAGIELNGIRERLARIEAGQEKILAELEALKDMPGADAAFQQGVNAILGYAGPKGAERD